MAYNEKWNHCSVVPAQWCLSLSVQRWSSVHPSAQRQVWVSSSWEVLTLHHSSSSFTMVPWSLIALLAGPDRTATIQGLWKALLLGEAVTVSPRTTPVVSKFNCLIEVVMTSTYQFSPSILSSRVIGLVSSTPDMVGEAVWVVASIKLAFCSTGWSSTWSLVEGTVVTCGDSGGTTLLKPVGVGWGHWLVAPWLTLPKPWMMSHLVKTACSFTFSLSSRTLLAKGQKSGSYGGLSLSAQYCNPQA